MAEAKAQDKAPDEAPKEVAPKTEGKGVTLRVVYPHHIHEFQSTATTALVTRDGTEVTKGAVKDLVKEAAESGVILEADEED